MFRRRSLSARKRRTERSDSTVRSSDQRTASLLERALRFVSFRPRSRAELASYLASKEPESQETQSLVLARLTELGYADDRAFADFLVRSRSGNSPRGNRRIRQELREKGVSSLIIEERLAHAARHGERDERALAKDLADRFVRKLGRNPARGDVARLYGRLLRAGFSSELTRSVIDEAIPKSYNTSQDI